MQPHVVIVGCGFGGLFAAKALRGKPVRVTVVDRTNHHLFQPLLYQVATAGLTAPAVAAPIRHILADQDNATVILIGFRNRIVMLIDWAVAYWTFDRNARIVIQGRRDV